MRDDDKKVLSESNKKNEMKFLNDIMLKTEEHNGQRANLEAYVDHTRRQYAELLTQVEEEYVS